MCKHYYTPSHFPCITPTRFCGFPPSIHMHLKRNAFVCWEAISDELASNQNGAQIFQNTHYNPYWRALHGGLVRMSNWFSKGSVSNPVYTGSCPLKSMPPQMSSLRGVTTMGNTADTDTFVRQQAFHQPSPWNKQTNRLACYTYLLGWIAPYD